MATQHWDQGADAARRWQVAQRQALGLWGRAVAWLLVVVGLARGMRLVHDHMLGATSWLGGLGASLGVTWALTLGGAATLWWGAQGVGRRGPQRLTLTAALALGAALCWGVGAGGLWVWSVSAGARLGAMGWVGLLGAAGAAARGWALTPTAAQGSHAWWVLAACWLVAWVPMSAGPVAAAAVAAALVATLWRLWRSQASGWSLGLGAVALTLDMLRGREVTFWAMAGALCAYGALTLLSADGDGDDPSSDDEALPYQSTFLTFGTLLLSVVAAALCCWAMNIPILWRGLFWPWGL